jgi:hypothetical protein
MFTIKTRPSYLAAVCALALASGLAVAPNAHATIVISAGQDPGNPDQNVQFNNNGGLGETGTTIHGFTNQTNTTVTYSSATTLHASGGQADITSASGINAITDLTWNLAPASAGRTSSLLFTPTA